MKETDPFEQEPFTPRPRLPRWTWILAVPAVILVIIGTVRMLQPQMDERLYARFRNLPEASFIAAGDSCCPDLVDASAMFNQKKYTRALDLFLKSDTASYGNDVHLFAGICYLELNQMQKAETEMATLLELPSETGQEALWYTALSRLRRHDRQGCVAILTQFSSDHPRYKAAQQLLQRGLQ